MRQFFTIALLSLATLTAASQVRAQGQGNSTTGKPGLVGISINGNGPLRIPTNNVPPTPGVLPPKPTNIVPPTIVPPAPNGRGQRPNGGGLFNNIGNGIGNTTTININSNNKTIIQQAAPAPRPVFVLPQISQPIVRPVFTQPVISQPTVVVAPAPTVASGTVSHIDLPKQSERLLRVRNDSGETLTVFVQIRTDDGQGTKRFFPAAPGGDEAFSFTIEAGQESTLQVGQTKLSGDAARIFAVSASGKVINEFKDKDLVLVPLPYQAAQEETFLFTFGR